MRESPLVLDAFHFDGIGEYFYTVYSVQTLELTSSSWGSFFGSHNVRKIKLLLQAFELVAVRTEQVFEVADTIMGYDTLRAKAQ